jgi:Sensors of blue-light using FAD
MQIIRLIYASVARPDIGYEDLSQILKAASSHNISNGISGLLCYSNGAFLQVLEGKRPRVNELYNRIIMDRRHSKCEILSCEAIEVRSFIEWSMKMVRWEDAHAPHRRALVLRHAGSELFEPWTMSSGQAHGFLRELAAIERKSELQQVAEQNVI